MFSTIIYSSFLLNDWTFILECVSYSKFITLNIRKILCNSNSTLQNYNCFIYLNITNSLGYEERELQYIYMRKHSSNSIPRHLFSLFLNITYHFGKRTSIAYIETATLSAFSFYEPFSTYRA